MLRYKGILVASALCLAFTGCSKPTEVRQFTEVAVADVPVAGAVAFDATPLLGDVLEAHNRMEAHSFWFNGYVRTNVERRSVTAMLDGVADLRAARYTVNGRVAQQPFRFYREGDKGYVWRLDKWTRASDAAVAAAFNPYVGYDVWLGAAREATKLPDADVLGMTCTVVQFKLSGAQWLNMAKDSSTLAAFRDVVANGSSADIATVAANTQVKATLYVDQATSRVVQQSTWLVMPVPGGGSVDQEIYWRFYKFNDPAIAKQLDTVRDNLRDVDLRK